jgi:tetratricopeptide (TPR) repeat protein
VLVGQSSVDWIWLIPGLTALGLFALSVGAAQVAVRSAPPALVDARVASPVRRGARVAAALGMTVAMLSVLSVLLSDAYVQRARALIGDPRAELSAAQTASTLEPWSLTPHYLEASALETMGNRPAAYAQLLDALRLEPRNFATLGVLGDFEARGHDFALARSYYRRALALDPLDTGLRQLSKLGLPGGAPN